MNIPRTFSGWKFILFFFFCLKITNAEDQNRQLDSLIEKARQLRALQIVSDKPLKCGLSVSLDILDHWDKFSDFQRQAYSKLLAPDPRQKSRIIGHFQIHYDTTGVHTPSLLDINGNLIPNTAEAYIDSVGKYFNVAWSYEIDVLGYDPPPFESGQNYYNVYVKELGLQLYGQTWLIHQINASNPARFDSYIEVDNDYLGFYSAGIAGLRVTSAHEFHHSIQIGSYGYWPTDAYFLELTSTWMEDVVHTDVNDYYQYLSNVQSLPENSIFAYPDRRFTLANGYIEYSRAVWGKFVEKRFSRDLILNTWRYIRQVSAISALDHALIDAGSSFRQAFLEWTTWNLNTGVNCDTVKYYDEGKNYPLMKLRPVIQYVSPQRSIEDNIQVLSCVYQPVLVNSSQMMVIVSNFNQGNSTSGQPFSYVMSDNDAGGFRHLTNGVYTKLNVSDPSNWYAQESVPSVVSDVVVMPNPFIVRSSSKLKFRLPATLATTATLSIFSNSLDRIFSGDVNIINPSEPFLEWNGQDEQNRTVSSGIYFYQIIVDAEQYMGRFAAVKE